MIKDQGLYNKPSAAVHPGPLAAGTLPQYNTTTSEEKISSLLRLLFSYFLADQRAPDERKFNAGSTDGIL